MTKFAKTKRNVRGRDWCDAVSMEIEFARKGLELCFHGWSYKLSTKY